MRIAIGQLWQESNTFNPWSTTRQDFEAFGILRGRELVERMADTNELGGFIQSLSRWPERPEIVGLARLGAWPGGMASAETFTWLRDILISDLRRAGPVDAVLLALHGSLVAEGTPDVEGEILEAIRQVIGPRIPLVATLDLHANVTRRMVDQADALVLYHTAPHLDVFETGQRGAAVLRRILDGARPVSAFQKLPMVVPAERANTQDPASVSHDFRRHLQELEAHPRILSAGLATVQPWLDIPELGSAILIVSDGDEELARSSCATLAAEVWRRRREYLPETMPLEEAVRQAHAEQRGLVVLSDSADSTTSGAPGDSTWVLRELLKYDWPRPALVPLVSPELVAEARQRGARATWEARLGGIRDYRFSTPVTALVTVAGLCEARFSMSGHLARNLTVDMGPTALLRAGGDVHIVVTSRTGPHFAPEFFQAAGLDPFAASVLVAKSPCGFRAAYAARAAAMMVVKAPGCAPSDFWHYNYRQIPRPLWPWDELTDLWPPVASGLAKLAISRPGDHQSS
jgi:microcystin degradation protein MlrC